MVSMVMCSRNVSPDPEGEAAMPAAPRLFIHSIDDPRRREVESFIRRVYAERYGADVVGFAPTLVSLRDDSGIVAAAGYRSAGDGRLFLEGYLRAPIETLLASHAERTPDRERIVEVGHLAASRAGEGRRLILLLARHLAEQRFDWVVSTLTSELRHLFVRIGVAPLALGAADPAALGPGLGRWGTYYDHHPVVLAGQLHQAMQQLLRRQQATGLA